MLREYECMCYCVLLGFESMCYYVVEALLCVVKLLLCVARVGDIRGPGGYYGC